MRRKQLRPGRCTATLCFLRKSIIEHKNYSRSLRQLIETAGQEDLLQGWFRVKWRRRWLLPWQRSVRGGSASCALPEKMVWYWLLFKISKSLSRLGRNNANYITLDSPTGKKSKPRFVWFGTLTFVQILNVRRTHRLWNAAWISVHLVQPHYLFVKSAALVANNPIVKSTRRSQP